MAQRQSFVARPKVGTPRSSFYFHVITDTQGLPLHVAVMPGQQHDATTAEVLLEHARGRAVLADKGYDEDRIIMAVLERGMQPVIGSSLSRKAHDTDLDHYIERHQVECFLHRIKRFRAVATRYEKTAQNYLVSVHIACVFHWLSALV